MRITICIECYCLILSSSTHYPFFFEWLNFAEEGGYPLVYIRWRGFSFSVNDF